MRIFQYGSNMDKSRIESRIGSVKDLGTGLLSNYTLVFDLHSKGNNCAVADIVPSSIAPSPHDMRGAVFGRGYEITDEQERRLRAIEGRNYRRGTLEVQHIGRATTFVGTDEARSIFRRDFEGELPSNEYLHFLINGLENRNVIAPVRYISQVIGVGRPNTPENNVEVVRSFDNRRDYRRSTIGVGRDVRKALGVEPWDFVVVEYSGPPVDRHPCLEPTAPLYLCVQKMPKELDEPEAVTISSEARNVMGVEKVSEIDREKFSTVFNGVRISKAR